MDQDSKAELIEVYLRPCQRATKREKTRITDFIVEITDYSRKHGIRVLRQRRSVRKKVRRKTTSRYVPSAGILEQIWVASNFLCGKRLRPFLPVLIQALERHGEISPTNNQQTLLFSVSAATLKSHTFGKLGELTTVDQTPELPGIVCSTTTSTSIAGAHCWS